MKELISSSDQSFEGGIQVDLLIGEAGIKEEPSRKDRKDVVPLVDNPCQGHPYAILLLGSH